MRALLRESRGAAAPTLLAFTPLWFAVFGTFLMNVQLGRNYVQRDLVDHAAAMAADAASKIVCADPALYGGAERGDLGGPHAAAVRAVVDPLLALEASTSDACTVSLRQGDGGPAPGARGIEVTVACDFACRIPIAAEAMCNGSPRRVTFRATEHTVAMGCDVRDRS